MRNSIGVPAVQVEDKALQSPISSILAGVEIRVPAERSGCQAYVSEYDSWLASGLCFWGGISFQVCFNFAPQNFPSPLEPEAPLKCIRPFGHITFRVQACEYLPVAAGTRLQAENRSKYTTVHHTPSPTSATSHHTVSYLFCGYYYDVSSYILMPEAMAYLEHVFSEAMRRFPNDNSPDCLSPGIGTRPKPSRALNSFRANWD